MGNSRRNKAGNSIQYQHSSNMIVNFMSSANCGKREHLICIGQHFAEFFHCAVTYAPTGTTIMLQGLELAAIDTPPMIV